MANVQITHTFVSSSTGVPSSGTLTVYLRGTSTLAALFTDVTGGTSTANPTTITGGLVAAWVGEGSYDLIATVGGVPTARVDFEAVSAASMLSAKTFGG